MAVILFLIGLFLAWPLSLLFRWNVYRRKLWFRGGALVLFLVGQALISFSAQAIVSQYHRKDWPTTPGLVIRSNVIGEQAFRPNIVYQYEMEGRIHVDSSSLDPASFGGRNARFNAARTISSEYHVGDSLTVWVNPVDHTETTLVDHVFWAEYLKISFGFGLFLFGMAGFVASFRSTLLP
jgi:hypothetical protein